MKISWRCIVLATVIGSASTIGAAAELTDAVPNRIVKFGDLDLGHSVGAAAAYQRIKSAAHEVCQPLNYRSLESDVRERECSKEAVGHAVMAINSPALTSYHLAQTGQSKFTAMAMIAREP
jgi:UrcA family protein